ncbi:MAG: hypothetical protein HKO63_08565 [Acidimicrobiia bacterium]|nr:hypothetical protein [Acidimicrobiia bacterium]NNF10243.1 hypothetical protein [Acidimicrobiia bacterium]NNL98242.1 hypothetical protein [Acidimicrobiia bacterium]
MDTFDQDPFGQVEAGQIAAPMPPAGGNRTRKLVLGGLIALAVIAIAAVAFATMNAGRSNDGAESPEAAMQKLFDGLSGEDLIGAVDAFLPSEADPVVNYTGAIGTELKRLDILTEGVDPQAVSGINMEFTDLQFRTEPIADGFVRVYVTDGDYFVDIDQAELPLGDVILDNLPADARAEFDQDLPAEAGSMAGEDFYMVAVEEDGGWYLSLWYTMMDAIFTETGYGTPAFGSGITPVGAESPEAAVRASFEELLSLDLEGLIGMLPPTEMRAVYDYMPLVMDDYNETVGAFGSFVTIELIDLGTSVSDAEFDAKRVKVESFDIEFSSFFLEIDGSLVFDGECFEIEINDQAGNLSGFGAEIPDRINSCDPELADALGGGFSGGLTQPDMPDFVGDIGAANIGFLAVEEDGRWYVSPTESMGDVMLQGLKIWDAETLQQYIEWIIEVGAGSADLSF